VQVIPKTGEAKHRIQKALEKSYLFTSLDKDQIRTVIDAVEEQRHKAGQVIIQQGDSGLMFYLLEAGSCEVWLQKRPGTNPEMVKTYSAGDSFGELALLYDAPRAATVKASTDCIVWAMDRATFRSILMTSTNEKRQLYEEFLENVPLLQVFRKPIYSSNKKLLSQGSLYLFPF
jgi:cAMP-dependent protein kinase regulator